MSVDFSQREVRLSRSMLLDAMVIGALLGRNGEADKIANQVGPDDMLSHTCRRMMEAIKDGDRKRFKKILATRLGVSVPEGASSLSEILLSLKTRNASEALRGMSQAISEAVAKKDRLDDMLEMWEEGIDLLRQIVELEKSRHERPEGIDAGS